MRKFKSFEEFEVFMQGINAAYDFIHPSVFRDDNFEAVMKALSDARSSLHCSKYPHPVYVLFGPQICVSVSNLSLEQINYFKTNYCILEILFCTKFIIVKQL